MAGYHVTSLTGVKCYVQNKVTGLYLNKKGYWQDKRVRVSLPTKMSAFNYAESLNANCEFVLTETVS
jgi:hypothetical protein